MNLLPHLDTGDKVPLGAQPGSIAANPQNTPLSQEQKLSLGEFSPENQNQVGGYVPMGAYENPTVVKGAELAGSLLPLGRGIKGAIGAAKLGKEAYDYLQPDKTAENFMTELGGGSKPTSEENVRELAKRINFSRTSNAVDALAHKTPVYEALGEKNISYNHPLYDIFEERDVKDYFEENSNLLKKWNSDKSPIGKLNNKFVEKPTLNNSDDLQQSVGGRIGDLKKKSLREPLDKTEQEELADLQKVRTSLQNDQDQFIEKQSPYLANQNKIFRQKWRENVTPYDDHPILSEISRKGTTEGFTPSEVKSIFSYPTANVQKILQDIGTSGKNNVLYNELQSAHPQDAKELASKILEAKQHGYQANISPEMEKLAKELQKRSSIAGKVKGAGKIATGAITGSVLGHPLVGSSLGAAWAVGRPALMKALELTAKK